MTRARLSLRVSVEKTDHKAALPGEEIIRRIKKALSREGNGSHTWEDVVELLKAGKAQIFFNGDGAWITEIIHSPRKRWLNVWVVAGQLPGVMDLQSKVVEFARSQGISDITATCRLGWKQIAREYGWKEKAMFITLKVPDEGR